jgi:hypothetical protein
MTFNNTITSYNDLYNVCQKTGSCFITKLFFTHKQRLVQQLHYPKFFWKRTKSYLYMRSSLYMYTSLCCGHHVLNKQEEKKKKRREVVQAILQQLLNEIPEIPASTTLSCLKLMDHLTVG